jgi:hypothetical protein
VSASVTPEFPENIILEPGGDVEGRFLRLESGPTRHGERPIAILDVDGVERSLWLLEKPLRGQFREKQPKPGELIRIVKGTTKKRSAGGFEYWPCRVHTPERDESISWDSPLLADDDASAPEPPQSDVPADFPGYGEPRATTAKPDGSDDDMPF